MWETTGYPLETNSVSDQGTIIESIENTPVTIEKFQKISHLFIFQCFFIRFSTKVNQVCTICRLRNFTYTILDQLNEKYIVPSSLVSSTITLQIPLSHCCSSAFYNTICTIEKEKVRLKQPFYIIG